VKIPHWVIYYKIFGYGGVWQFYPIMYINIIKFAIKAIKMLT